MSCEGTTDYVQAVDVAFQQLSNAEFVDAFTCTFANALGGFVVFGTILWFVIVTMSYIRSGSFAMPLVLTLLIGGAALQQVAAPVIGFASILIPGGLAILGVLIARRIDR